MDEHRNDSDAGGARNQNSGGDSAAKSPNFGNGDADMATPNETGAATGQDVTAAISQKITYSVSIEEAQERFAHLRRKVPSIRTLQRDCVEGLVSAIRTPVTYGDGSHGKPWFLNAESLDSYIKKQPIVVLGDDSDAKQPSVPPPHEIGGASVAKPSDTGGAGGANNTERREEPRPSDPPALAPPTILSHRYCLRTPSSKSGWKGRQS